MKIGWVINVVLIGLFVSLNSFGLNNINIESDEEGDLEWVVSKFSRLDTTDDSPRRGSNFIDDIIESDDLARVLAHYIDTFANSQSEEVNSIVQEKIKDYLLNTEKFSSDFLFENLIKGSKFFVDLAFKSNESENIEDMCDGKAPLSEKTLNRLIRVLAHIKMKWPEDFKNFGPDPFFENRYIPGWDKKQDFLCSAAQADRHDVIRAMFNSELKVNNSELSFHAAGYKNAKTLFRLINIFNVPYEGENEEGLNILEMAVQAYDYSEQDPQFMNDPTRTVRVLLKKGVEVSDKAFTYSVRWGFYGALELLINEKFDTRILKLILEEKGHRGEFYFEEHFYEGLEGNFFPQELKLIDEIELEREAEVWHVLLRKKPDLFDFIINCEALCPYLKCILLFDALIFLDQDRLSLKATDFINYLANSTNDEEDETSLKMAEQFYEKLKELIANNQIIQSQSEHDKFLENNNNNNNNNQMDLVYEAEQEKLERNIFIGKKRKRYELY